MSAAIHVILLLVAIPAVFSCLYLLLLTMASGRPAIQRPCARSLRFDVIVPAHNEAQVIQRAVQSLRGLDWPRDQYRLVVVADNCSDATAELAAAAGAEVLERSDAVRRGKGYALDYAFARSAEAGLADAVVVVDADTDVAPNLLEAFAARLESGAGAVQAHYGVRNPNDSWRTRLMTVAMAAFHDLRSQARERLGLSCGIRGNGWCVSHALLARVPYRAYSLTEDLEYGVDLGLAGYRVHYAAEAEVAGDMVSGSAAASSQRQRWEKGRMALVRSRTLPLLASGIRRASAVCLDLAMDLLVLPLSYVALNVLLLLGLSALFYLLDPGAAPWIWAGLACLTALIAYVLRGWQLSGTGLAGLADLLRAPFFIIWKVVLMLRSRRPQEWVRTEREQP